MSAKGKPPVSNVNNMSTGIGANVTPIESMEMTLGGIDGAAN